MKLSRTVTGLLSVALLAFMVSDTLAQEGPRRGDRGGRPGGGFRGGPGGGGPGGGRPGGGDPTLGLLRVEEVRTELQIAPDQEEALTKLAEQLRPQRPNLDFRSMSEDERQAAFDKMRQEFQQRVAKMKEQLEEVLLPEQIERLEQISLQVRGVQALMEEAIAEKLKVTEQQKQKMAEIREGLGQEMREAFMSRNREALEKLREEMESGVLAVLSDDQQRVFEELKGEKFDMPDFMGRGGFGGRGGRGGPGGGRGGFGGPGGRRPSGDDGGRRPRPETED